ncbi:SH3 domain-containing protein [Roseovarius sp. SK2]|uniref:SH3 domain-containing protein n=1 Tax=Roseovarius TaxID=74030 RepID=UPI00237AF692|nr:SH3 domain-containing protein [Roseovarius sp. SK2]MDD9725092.1 SH3 domain-containing protein [Roseovarius sp. SK2]
MWRFILVTFAFLGFAFWEMSGGADYAPRDNSIQAQANAAEPETTVADAQPAEPAEPVEPEVIDLPEQDKPERFQITLASLSDMSEAGSAQETARTERVEDKARFLTESSDEDNAVLAALDEGGAAADEVKKHWPGAIELFEHQASQAELRKQAEAAARTARSGMTSGDIRYVTATSANMRGGPGTDFARVGNLAEGVEVAVLGTAANGWLELEVLDTGETGWMADWLVSAPAR